MQYDAIQAGANWLQMPSDILATSQIDDYVDYLVQFIQNLIEQTVPTAKGSEQAKPWWSVAVAEAIRTERRARRQFTAVNSEANWEWLTNATAAKRRLIASEKRAYWRAGVHEAASSPQGAWRLAKWARTKSHLPPEPAKMPDLQLNGALTSTVEGKATALAERFWPTVEADLTDITDQNFATRGVEPLEMRRTVTDEEVYSILKKVKPDKCPGIDGIPNRFLQAMGAPLARAITELINTCWRLEYYPQRFRQARTIVLRKPEKDDYSVPGAYRPIALLSTIGKVIESLAARRLQDLAEQHNLIPETQMGNRPNRSTDTAVDLLVEQIHTVWESKDHLATVLSLDISGAFDTVNHTRLLDNLRQKGVPLWFVRTVRSFLTDRSTTLVVDGVETASRRLSAGVPQGSNLSPILFLFYNAPLLEALNMPNTPISPIGFADDINLLTYSESLDVNCINLELAHEKCLAWARTHGMRFAPDKYKLTHFTRRRGLELTRHVQIGGVTIQPSPSVTVLGLRLDSDLRWKTQTTKVETKMKTQALAISRTTASTWGLPLRTARQVYTAVVRSSMAHGAPIWHVPGESPAKGARGTAKNLQKHQQNCLRVVLGAFKSTAVTKLEIESHVPPLDLWLNGRVACYQARLERSGVGQQIRNACAAIRSRIRSRTQRGR